MVNQYETVFIVTPVLSDDQMKETVQKYMDFLSSRGAEIVHTHNWGMRKLAYPIKKKSTGFYYLIEFKAEGSLIADLEIAYNEKKRAAKQNAEVPAAE